MRHDSLETGLEELNAGALLVLSSSSQDPDLARFVGSSHLGHSFVLWQRGCDAALGYLVDMERDEASASGLDLLPPDSEVMARLRRQGASAAEVWSQTLEAAFAKVGLEPQTLALAGHLGAGLVHEATRSLAERGFDFVDGQALATRLRKVKSAGEIEQIRAAAAGAREAFRAVASTLAGADGSRAGAVTAGELRAAVSRTLAAHGLEQPEGNIVAVGADAGVPHTRGQDQRILGSGESIIVDLYPRGRMFADCTRTFCLGEPPETLRKAHGLCLEVLNRAVESVSPGIDASSLQDAACEHFEAAGFLTPRTQATPRSGYVHGLGHGVGYELHELPSFRKRAGADGRLEVGDVFTLEPGLYDPEAGYGVRLEDLFVLTDDGAENLTPLPYDLDPRAWRA